MNTNVCIYFCSCKSAIILYWLDNKMYIHPSLILFIERIVNLSSKMSGTRKWNLYLYFGKRRRLSFPILWIFQSSLFYEKLIDLILYLNFDAFSWIIIFFLFEIVFFSFRKSSKKVPVFGDSHSRNSNSISVPGEMAHFHSVFFSFLSERHFSRVEKCNIFHNLNFDARFLFSPL